MTSSIQHIFIGGLSTLEPEGQSTGIFKHAATGAVRLRREGLEGDIQADRRVHGGPEKALHHYAAENYALLAGHLPQLAEALVPGSLGENLSTAGWTEGTVCIGDVFRIGACRVQVSQPRSPCWKINHKFGDAALSRFIAERGVGGWYYRVLEGGAIRAGDAFELLERNTQPITLRRLWQANVAHRPAAEELRTIAATPGLSPGWMRKFNERFEWLQRNPELPL